MAKGDAQGAIINALAAGATYDIRPASGVEWVIHNIEAEADADILLGDGTNFVKYNSFVGPKTIENMSLHVTNALFVRLKNTSSAAAQYGWTGIETK